MVDALQQLEDFKREEIVNSNGVTYSEFRKALTPKYWRVGVDIAFGYLMLVAGIFVAIFIQSYERNYQWIALVVLPVFFGYFHNYLQLFLHEAAHFNIAKNRKFNDFVANTFLGSLIGANMKIYRPTHFIHHRELGTPNDSERSYFEALTFRFIVESLTGIRAARVLLSWERRKMNSADKGMKIDRFSMPGYHVIVGTGIHGFILCLALVFQWWILMITWLAGLLVMAPFFGSIRQLMEHRDENAPSDKDFTKYPHGKVNRMFGTGPIASTLGGAGFNRHLLHHFDPQISYTNLAEVEDFLNHSNVSPILAQCRTGYFRTFFQMLRWK